MEGARQSLEIFRSQQMIGEFITDDITSALFKLSLYTASSFINYFLLSKSIASSIRSSDDYHLAH